MSNSWKRALSAIEKALEHHDAKLSILRKIDQSISAVEPDLVDALYAATNLLLPVYKIRRYGIFGFVDKCVFTLRWSHTDFKLSDVAKDIRRTRTNQVSNAVSTYVLYDGKRSICSIQFVYGSTIYWVFDTSELDEDLTEFHEFITNFCEQLATFIRHYVFRRKQNAERLAYEVFFDNKLRPSACWAGLLSTLDMFVPHPSFVNPEPPHIKQLLVHSESETSLRIAAGQGSEERQSKYVLVDRSISGLVLKGNGVNLLLVNPQRHKRLYKGYGDKPSQTELVLRLDSDGEPVGVINIEHTQRRAFNSVYVQSMREAADFLSPLVAALQHRYDTFRKKEIGLMYIFTDMLSRLGDTYSHLLSQPLLDARSIIAEIRYQIDQPHDDAHNVLLREVGLLERTIDDLETRSEQFTNELPEFVSFGSQPVRAIIERRLRAFKRLAESEAISLEINEDTSTSSGDLHAYASPLFQEHVFNIVNNSFQQIRTRIFEGLAKAGRILIDIRRTPGTTRMNQDTGLNYIDIIISDNGGGAPLEFFPKIGRPMFTTKGESGTGFGVAAAKEYFESVGGSMTWRNINGGFETTIRLQEFKSGIHDENRLMDKIRREAMR